MREGLRHRGGRIRLALDEHRHEHETDLGAILRLLDEHPARELLVLVSRTVELGAATLDGQGRLVIAWLRS